MADVNRGDRPLSPHLQVYRPQLTSITSILTRITGNALIVAALLIVWWLLAAATSAEYFAVADGVLRSWFGKLVLLGSVWAVWYHFLAGLSDGDLDFDFHHDRDAARDHVGQGLARGGDDHQVARVKPSQR